MTDRKIKPLEWEEMWNGVPIGLHKAEEYTIDSWIRKDGKSSLYHRGTLLGLFDSVAEAKSAAQSHRDASSPKEANRHDD